MLFRLQTSPWLVHRLCRRCHCHCAGEQGTGDDAEASLSALSLPSTCTSVHCCCCHCHRAGKQGTGDDAEASLPALSPSSLRYVVRSAAVVAIAWASEGQVMMPRHHNPPCHRCQRAQASAPPLPPPLPLPSRGQARDRAEAPVDGRRSDERREAMTTSQTRDTRGAGREAAAQ